MGNFGTFGVANRFSLIKPSKIRGLLIGPRGGGKTSFFGSNEAFLIVNLDCSSCPKPAIGADPLPAQFFPFMSSDGLPIGIDGKPVVMDFECLIDLKDRLVKAAKDGLPRPEGIVLDSLSALIDLARAGTLKYFKKDTWDEGRGDAMWEWLYQRINDIFTQLRDAGYGVWVAAHLTDEVVVDGNNNKTVKWSLNAPPGFFKRFLGSFEMVLEIEKITLQRKILVPTVSKVGESSVTVNLEKMVDETKFSLVGFDPAKANLLKCRIPFPTRLELPAKGGWQVFESEYNKAAQ